MDDRQIALQPRGIALGVFAQGRGPREEERATGARGLSRERAQTDRSRMETDLSVAARPGTTDLSVDADERSVKSF